MSEKGKCERCGYPMRKHWSVTFCNGVQQSGEVLVCPTAVYLAPSEPTLAKGGR